MLEPALALTGSTLSLASTPRAEEAHTQKAIGDQRERQITGRRESEPGIGKDGITLKVDGRAALPVSKDAAKMTIKLTPELKRDVILKGGSAPSPSGITEKLGPDARIVVYSPGVISNDVQTFGGKAALPLADVARAFGGTASVTKGTYEITVPQ
ncbi:MAG: hypothetical protein NVS4B3_28320 [Gemmatimonadaceae bacterium]